MKALKVLLIVSGMGSFCSSIGMATKAHLVACIKSGDVSGVGRLIEEGVQVNLNDLLLAEYSGYPSMQVYLAEYLKQQAAKRVRTCNN